MDVTGRGYKILYEFYRRVGLDLAVSIVSLFPRKFIKGGYVDEYGRVIKYEYYKDGTTIGGYHGGQFKSFDEVLDAYYKQIEDKMPGSMFWGNFGNWVWAEYTPYPLQSALYDGCIQKGRDWTNGGTPPPYMQGLGGGGGVNVSDSLAAIKKVVFEDKKITMSRLIDALDKNFEGEDEVLHALNSVPKFGNDDDYVDSIMSEVLLHERDIALKYYRGWIEGAKLGSGGFGSPSYAVQIGRSIGALPDGRKAGKPLTDVGTSGRNVNGPTATMRSMCKIDPLRLGGSILNMRFSPSALKDESKIRKFVSLLRAYCENGGNLVQFNITDTETLRDAQRHPEKYRDLLVRVATYSAYFVELSPEHQDHIITRMEFEEV